MTKKMTKIDMILLESSFNKLCDIPPIENKSSEDTHIQPPTSGQKWWASLLLGMLFVIVSSGLMYSITSGLLYKFTGSRVTYTSSSHITLPGILIHGVIFILLVRIIMG